MVSFGFFNSSNGDRKYSADDVSRIFSYLITDGVLMTYGDKFFTTPATANLGVVLGTGWAWFNHTWTQSDTAIPFTLDEPDPSLDRFDTVYLKVDRRSLGRMNSLGVVKGTAAINPQKPTFPTETDVFYHPLAYVKVRHGVTRIAASDIEILSGKTQAPFITSILQTTDITTLFQGWSEQFGTKMNEWEAEIDALETSANQQLQTQQTQFTTQLGNQQTTFTNSLNGWETDFQTWFDNLQTYLSQDVVTEIWADLQKLETGKISKSNEWLRSASSSAPFVGKNSLNTFLPKFGETKYATLLNYKYVMSNGVLKENLGFYPGPQAIMDMILKVPGCSGPVFISASGTYGFGYRDAWVTFIIIGGGGGAGGTLYTSTNVNDLHVAGGGGGAGEIVIATRFVKAGSTLVATIGAGGTNGAVGAASGSVTRDGTTGGATTLKVTDPDSNTFSLTANGGSGGKLTRNGTTITISGGSGGYGSTHVDSFSTSGGGGGGGSLFHKRTGTSMTYAVTANGGDGMVTDKGLGFGGGGGGGGSIYIFGTVSNSHPIPSSLGGICYLTNNSVSIKGGKGAFIVSNNGDTITSLAATDGSTGIGGLAGGKSNIAGIMSGGGGSGGVSSSGGGGNVKLSSSATTISKATGGGGGGGIFARGGGIQLTNNSFVSRQAHGVGHGGGGGNDMTTDPLVYHGGGGGGWGWIPYTDAYIPTDSTITGGAGCQQASSGGIMMIINAGYQT